MSYAFFLQQFFSAKKRILLLYIIIISIAIVYYVANGVIEVRKKNLLVKYNELSFHFQEHSIMAKKFNIKNNKESKDIDVEVNKSFENRNIIFTASLLDDDKFLVEINSAKFSSLLDAIIDVSDKYGIDVYSANIYTHQDYDNGYISGDIIFFK
ncbi:membrane protein [Yersinia similis]|uniref:hypothetical protein n=1 Tax=Yersinia similis TaxID=367190 RepID=UPI0005E123BB|nr:hypothetical protein [Yersinia similis]CNE84874.1 membrane protein [Yersinia similis]